MSSTLATLHEEFHKLPGIVQIATGAVAIGAPLAYYWYIKKRPRKSPLKEDWKKDVVYIYQYPPTAVIANLSPYSLKLETWLRMADIKFENVPCSMSLRSKEGTLPFVELNGKEYVDSAFIIRDLSRIFNINENLSPEQEGAGRAFEIMMEQNTYWSYAQLRYIENADVLLSKTVLGFELPFMFRVFQPARMMRSGLKTKLWYMGLGRHERDEIINIGLDDLRAISKYLSGKPFMMGDKPSKVDCCLFGFLSQIVYVPIPALHLDLMQNECKNLVDYTHRMKEKFWPDWDTVRSKRPVIF